MDWNELQARIDIAFGDERWSGLERGRSPFEGRNFMTDEVLAVVRVPHTGHAIEVSTGTFLSDRLFGFTINDPLRESQCCHSLQEVYDLCRAAGVDVHDAEEAPLP
jgi:hypothetical protein